MVQLRTGAMVVIDALGVEVGDKVSEGRERYVTPRHRWVTPGFAFTGGRIHEVVYDIGTDAYVDLQRRLGARLTRD